MWIVFYLKTILISISINLFCAHSHKIDSQIFGVHFSVHVNHSSDFVTVIEPNQHSGKKKLLSTSNGFGVQLTETISTAKWFWHNFPIFYNLSEQ